MGIREIVEEMLELGFEEVTYLNNPDYASAIIGHTGEGNLVYSYSKMVEYLVEEEGMSEDDAYDQINVNTIRSIPYMGDQRPIVVYDIPTD